MHLCACITLTIIDQPGFTAHQKMTRTLIVKDEILTIWHIEIEQVDFAVHSYNSTVGVDDDMRVVTVCRVWSHLLLCHSRRNISASMSL